MRDVGYEVQDARSTMSYRGLEIWALARQMAIAVHRMTLQDLPKFEMYEEGSQIRRSAKSVSANIVEGYGRRRYKLEFIRFLVFAHSSCDETIDHLLGRKLNVFIDSVERLHRTNRGDIPNPATRIAHLVS